MDGKRHFVVDRRNATFYTQDYPTSKKPSIFSPLLFDGERAMQSKSRMLRVLWMDTEDDIETGEVNLRFLFGGYSRKLSSSISQLWSLQTLIVYNYKLITAPNEIWEMPQLRHINMWSVYLPDPIPGDDGLVLEKLQMFHNVRNFTFSEEFCKRMPNIKDLKISFNQHQEHSCYQMQNIGLLKKLESLYCTGRCYDFQFKNLTLPCSLKELTLESCKLVESDMRMIGSLPHLQILILQGNQLVGEEWNVFEGGFRCLNYLEICGCDELIKWNIADTSCCFPVLETLCLSCSKLEEVPPCIGEIPTLESIQVFYCSESITISAVNILEEQESLGNQALQVTVRCHKLHQKECVTKKIQELGFTCQNLDIFHDLV